MAVPMVMIVPMTVVIVVMMIVGVMIVPHHVDRTRPRARRQFTPGAETFGSRVAPAG
jgi:hypothetical protein